MKASMYFNYTSRSLLRGGQRTLLALFCVAVGVMAIVALQLVGLMINNALTSNVRDANGGDIAVSAQTEPLTQSDLAFFDQLKKKGIITNYTAYSTQNGSLSLTVSLTQSFNVMVVNPATFPVVTPPTFVDPPDGTIVSLLKNNQVIVDQSFIDQYNKKLGDTFDMHVTTANRGGLTIPVRIAAIVKDDGALAQASGTLLIASHDYYAANPRLTALYDTVDITTVDQAHTDQAVKAIQTHFPVVRTQTATDALKNDQQQVDYIKQFLEIAGLLALLIGGVGIINTMQVLLSRRKIEIAMLKTTGYRRTDLYLLFGLETGLLGLIGGVIGAAAAIGVSYVVRGLVQQVFQLNISFVLDPLTIAGGIVIGLFTALIFGLMPIVQAANIRPLNVIRELPEGGGATGVLLTIGLLLLLSVLFCVMAVVILGNPALGIGSVYGAFIFLGILSAFFGLVVFVISVLPVPERFNSGYLALVLVAVVISLLIMLVLPPFGALLLAVSLLGIVIVVLPRSWKSNTRLALRNIGRQRARTTTTMLALFVGVFTIGLILVLGQDLRDKINNALAQSLTFNVITITSNSDATKLETHLNTIPGLQRSTHRTIASTVPLAINDTPISTLLPKGNTQPSANNLGSAAIYFLSGIEGYDVAHNQLPSSQDVTIAGGRNLNASDAGTNDVLISWELAHTAPLQNDLKLGSTITVASQDGKVMTTLTVVGFYQEKGLGSNLEPILGTTHTVAALSPDGTGQTIFYMKINTSQVDKAVGTIGRLTPNASVVNLANIGDFINQVLNDMLLTLIAIASLSLLAGVIIIANAVALAMLERRRELGILKSVGYTSRSILSEVLIENGVIGGAGALLAMLLVTLATSLLGQFVFHTSFGVSGLIALSLIIGIALLAMLVAAVVAWGAVRVRPLEVLRYE
ncbi:MAG TPA: FtsX-like permease family protein [Ktedonobacteraceae bacterium]|nr:FtsX-like permease family protein [Ktedonobacteraceae bacterium]